MSQEAPAKEPRPGDLDYSAYHGSLTDEGRQELYRRIKDEHEAARSAREAALTKLRAEFKASHYTYASIARNEPRPHSIGFIGLVMRGNFPHYGANGLTRGIAESLRHLGFEVPEILE